MHSGPDSPAPKRKMRQEERSAAMRERLLDATVECLVRRGYGGTTTIEVAERAGVSRGAMLHHFPSRAELVGAAIDHLATRRIARFVSEASEFPDDDTLPERILALLWAQFESDSFDAALELSIAARTDPELRALIAPLEARFDALVAHWARALFARFAEDEVAFERQRRFVYYLLTGLALKRRGGGDPQEIDATLADLRASLTGAYLKSRRAVTNRRKP